MINKDLMSNEEDDIEITPSPGSLNK